MDTVPVTSTTPNPDWYLFALLSTWVLFAVFLLSAVAFILTIFGVLKPDKATRTYLFALFAASTVGIFASYAKDFLHYNPSSVLDSIKTHTERQQAAADAQAPSVAPNGAAKKLTVFVQIGSDKDEGKFKSLKNTLPLDKYIIPGVENLRSTISNNQIRYCNTNNQVDAQSLADLLKEKGFNTFAVIKISSCDPQTNLNILEVWLQSGG
jgi:hypothetical protein